MQITSFDTVQVWEDNNPVKFTMVSVSDSSKKQGILFLIESSFVTQGPNSNFAIKTIVNGVSQYLNQVGTEADYALAYYNRTNKNYVALNKLSNGFVSVSYTLDDSLLSLVDKKYTEETWTDMYKAVYESLEWMMTTGKKYSSLRLVVIGTGKALSESPIKETECIVRANSSDIRIYTIGFKSNDRYAYDNMKMLSEKTNGAFTEEVDAEGIVNTLKKYLSEKTGSSKVYSIEYLSKADANGDKHTVRIGMGADKLDFFFEAPNKEGNIRHYLMFGGGVLVIIIAGIIIWFWQKRKRKGSADVFTSISEKTSAFKESSDKNIFVKTGVQETVSAPPSSTEVNPSEKRKYTQITVLPTMMVIKNGDQLKTINLSNGITTVGRNSLNNIIVPNDTVSGNHFQLEYDGFSCKLTNLSNTNGTFVNGAKVPQATIYAGDKVKIGLVDIFFK